MMMDEDDDEFIGSALGIFEGGSKSSFFDQASSEDRNKYNQNHLDHHCTHAHTHKYAHTQKDI